MESVVSQRFSRLEMSVSFHMLPPEMLRGLEERFVEKNGGPREDNEDTTPEQLSALAARFASDEAPYADFTIFSPFGKRAVKLMTFLAQIFVGCELTTKSAAGPWDFEQWRKCWPGVQDGDVEAQCIAAGPLALDACEEGLRQLSTGFPQYWGHVSVVEDQLRSERWETLRGRVESMAQKSQLPGSWDPNRSWAAVIAYSAFGTGGSDMPWWFGARGQAVPAIALRPH